ncbi:MAG: hypothetical protein QW390_02715 [Candidatus Bathyarchaeia archaeon]
MRYPRVLVVRIPSWMDSQLAELSRRTRHSESDLVRTALERFIREEVKKCLTVSM